MAEQLDMGHLLAPAEASQNLTEYTLIELNETKNPAGTAFAFSGTVFETARQIGQLEN